MQIQIQCRFKLQINALFFSHLSPSGPALRVGDDPDVVGPQLHVVDLLGDVPVSLGKDQVAWKGHQFRVAFLEGPIYFEKIGSSSANY